jgi:t-SNARE complex subunit (syntaxin)
MEDEKKRFMRLVNESYLEDSEKDSLLAAAKDGVNQELWKRLGDLLMAALETRRANYRDFRSQLDTEVAKYTAVYEKEKRVLDERMRQRLQELDENDSEARDRLWDEYYSDIHALQGRLLDEVRKTSKTVLRSTVLASVSGQAAA